MKTRDIPAFLALLALCISAAPALAAIDATVKVKVLLQRSTFSAASDTTTNTYLLKNTSTATLFGPFRVVLESLDNRDVAVLNPDGYTPEGNPYFEYAKASLDPSAKTPGKPWKLYQRCGKKVTAAVKPFDTAWQITPPASCSPIATLHVSVLASEGGANHAPLSDAGPDQTVKVGAVIPLDGSASSDEDGNPLTYRWSVVSKPAGSRVTLAGATAVRPTVKFTLAGTYEFGLTVRDGALTSARDTCTLTTVNSRPVADAGPDQTVELGPVRLDGAGSTDADGDRLSYSWSVVAMPAGAEPNLTGATTVRPSLMADTPGEYVLQLVVSHGTKRSYPDFYRISTTNSLPRAFAGSDRKVTAGASVRLDGAGSSDADGEPLTWRWALLSKPAGSATALSEVAAVRPTFTADVAGMYVAQLIVNDGNRDSAPISVVVTTVNTRPLADAGRDQHASVGGRVTLDGSGSVDADASALAWKWSLLSAPRGSLARLAASTTAAPSFTADKAGTYVVQLAVSDGTLKAFPDTVVVDTRNSPPTAEAGDDQEVYTDRTVSLDGGGSADPDGDFLNPFWALLLKPEGSAAVLSDPTAVSPSFLADLPGTYVLQLIVRDDSFVSDPDTVAVTAAVRMVSVPYVVGMVQADAESEITGVGLSVGTITTAYSDYEPKDHVISQHPSAWDSVAEGSAVSLVVSLGPQTFAVPDVTGLPRAEAESAIVSAGFVVGTLMREFNEGAEAGTVISQSPRPGATMLPGSTVSLVLSLGSIVIPPDPATTAPPVDRTVASTLSGATAFLYSGDHPVQFGVEPGTIETRRAAVLRGRVLTREESPLAGVAVSVLGHPEYGVGVSRDDGMFDMAVNGGGDLTVEYAKAGHLTVQRRVSVPWGDFAGLPEVIMLPLDPTATTVDLTRPDPVQVVRGSAVTDVAGFRQATLLFPAGTTAAIVGPDGTVEETTTLTIRATEYTVGATGPRAMPAELPATSGYTYCAEFSADEALSARAAEVRFSQPVVNYLENFLQARVGSIVPVGYYDRAAGTWVPSENGRVIKIVAVAGDPPEAAVDTDGDDVADGGLGITDAERRVLATLYTAGQTLWRVPLAHFTPQDYNWPFGPPKGARAPGQRAPGKKGAEKRRCKEGGSIIGCQSQTLGEAIDIAGTPFSLHYESDRVPGRAAAYTLEIPLSGASVPEGLARIDLEIFVAGRKFDHSVVGSQCAPACLGQSGFNGASYFCSAPGLGGMSPGRGPVGPAATGDLLNQSHTFTWDGKDAYGRTLQGSQPVTVRIGYVYCGVYMEPAERAKSFADLSGVYMTGSSAGQQVTLWQEWNGSIGPWDGRGQGLGGWTLSAHHSFEHAFNVLHRGDGDDVSVGGMAGVMTTVAGKGGSGAYGGDGGPATEARLWRPLSPVVAPDGSLYFVDSGNDRVRRVSPDGLITTVAGRGYCGFSGDGGPATEARLCAPDSMTLGPDGSLYIADWDNYRVRRVWPDGIITTVAGNGRYCWDYPCGAGDGGPATEAEIDPGGGLAVGPDGSLYIPEYWTNRIRRVGLDGIITTVVGKGTPGGHGAYSGDGGAASLAELYFPGGPAFAPDGSLYFIDQGNKRIRRVGPDGIITTVAGNGTQGFSGDGGPATLAQFDRPRSLDVGPDGGVYVADTYNNRIRRVVPDGIVTTAVGSGQYPTSKEEGEGGPATAAPIGGPLGIGFGPDGSMYVTALIHVVRKIAPPVPSRLVGETLVASEDGTEIYAFNGSGRHLRTLDAVSGAVRFLFSYDGVGLLTGVADGDGRVTTVERGAEGIPQAIVAPSGARTALALNPEAYLSSVTDPMGAVHALGYGDGGLLASLTDPRGFIHTFTYDAQGLLTEDADPAGGSLSLGRADLEGGYEVSVTTAESRTTTYRVEDLATGDTRRTRTAPGGSQTQVLLRTDDTRTITLADEITADFSGQPDPRFGMQSPLPETLTVTTPGGLSSTLTASRSMTYSDPADLLSIGTMTDTVTVNGRAYQTVFDGAEKRFTETSPEGRAGTVRIDDHGRVVERQLAPGALLPVTFQYNSSGLLERIQQGDQFWTYAYDSRMRVSSRTDAAGQVVRYAHDDADRLTGTTLPSGRTYAFAYDPSGNRTQVVMPSGAAHGFSYNAVDLPAGYDPPGGAPYARVYDRDRGLAQATLPGGRTISRTYDASGRLSREEFPEGAVDFAYVGAGCCGEEARVAAMSRAPAGGGTGQSIAYAYDGPFVTQQTWSGAANATHRYRYNNDFFLVGTTFDAEPETGFGWDKDGRVTTYGPFTFTRGGGGGATSQLGDGTLNLPQTYDPLGRIVERVHTVGGTEMYRLHLTYDVVGRISQREETVSGTSHTFSYSYDLDGRLTGVSGAAAEAYGYDLNGNRITANGTPATYDAQDRMVSRGGLSYAFDADGFMTARGADSFQYSARGELLQAAVGGESVQYVYDGFGRRVSRTVGGATHQYFYGNPRNVFQVTEARDPAGVLSHYYYDELDLLFAVRRGISWYYVATDQVGTPVAVSDAAGVIVKALTHDSFGNLLTDSNPGFDLPIGFAGGLADPLTGLLRFGMRDYDPGAGRWAGRDPVAFQGTVGNLYVYANNNPVNLRDPSGLFSVGVSAYAGIGAGVRFNYTSEGTQVCFEVGLGIGGGIEVDPQGGLDHDGAYIKGEAEASIGPFGGKIGGRLLDCGEMEGEADCKFGPLYCSGKIKAHKPKWADRDVRGVKVGAKVASNFCMTMRY